MCIRDSISFRMSFLFRESFLTRFFRSSSPMMNPSQGQVSIPCLLYTSDAADRIDRCPSRGLGDVYKRQHQFSYEFFIPRIFFNQVFPIFFPNDEPFTGSGFNTRVYLAHHKISKRQTVPVHFCLEFLSHCISKDPATIIKEGLVYRES